MYNPYSTLGQPVPGPSSAPLNIDSSSHPRTQPHQYSNTYPTNVPYSQMDNQPQPQAWASSSLSSSHTNQYVTNSQNAWMNWSTIPPPPPLPLNSSHTSAPTIDSSYNSTYNPPSSISYGYFATNDSGLNDYSNMNENGSMQKDQKEYVDVDTTIHHDKLFDTAFAAPAINLGTGDRFSQLLEAKMSMMNGSPPAIASGTVDTQPRSYEYRLGGHPSQIQNSHQTNPYPPISTSMSTSLPSMNSQSISDGPASAHRVTEISLPSGAQKSSVITTQTTTQVAPTMPNNLGESSRLINHSPPQWMPNPATYNIPPPPPPQGDLSSIPTSSSSSPSIMMNSLYNPPIPSPAPASSLPQQQYSVYNQPSTNGSFRQSTYCAQQKTSLDPLAVEKHLSDWSQTQIQPDLVAPLPASIQQYQRHRSPTMVIGDGEKYGLHSNITDYNHNQIPHSHPSAHSASAPNSSNNTYMSPSLPHLQAHPSTSAPASARSSKSPTSLPNTIPRGPHQSQKAPAMPSWSTSTQSTRQEKEDLPPLLKIRMKDAAKASADKHQSSEWVSKQPGLIKKKTGEATLGRPKTLEKGKKFSYSTSFSKADLPEKPNKGKGKGKKRENNSQDKEDEVEELNESTVTAKPEKKKRKVQVEEIKEQTSTIDIGQPRSTEMDTSSSQAEKPQIDKTIIACNNCRAKKLKCNGEKPKCFHCHRRGEDVCVYEAILRRRGPGKHNKEKVTKPMKSSSGKKRKGGSSKGDIANQEVESGSSPASSSNNSEDESQTQSTSDKSRDGTQKEKYIESFGLGGGGSEGRIKSRRLNEDEIKNMDYILGSSSTDAIDHQQSYDRNSNGGNLGMGFGNNLKIKISNNINMPQNQTSSSLGSGSRFELSTLRD
ncbi:uncharacterized protein L201_000492 [Kwoniella dendrophila CBS 6074]|uniref:Zn(2)-C6 fungal-type domain-containing protein n=1 Tax=Kwoniella dendrophila CBS 6074 TaxID=1295534 RepID=A0AAX4JJP3_9TREE